MAVAAHVKTVVGAAFIPVLFMVEPSAACQRSLRATPYQVTVPFLAAGQRGRAPRWYQAFQSVVVAVADCVLDSVQSEKDVASPLPPLCLPTW